MRRNKPRMRGCGHRRLRVLRNPFLAQVPCPRGSSRHVVMTSSSAGPTWLQPVRLSTGSSSRVLVTASIPPKRCTWSRTPVSISATTQWWVLSKTSFASMLHGWVRGGGLTLGQNAASLIFAVDAIVCANFCWSLRRRKGWSSPDPPSSCSCAIVFFPLVGRSITVCYFWSQENYPGLSSVSKIFFSDPAGGSFKNTTTITMRNVSTKIQLWSFQNVKVNIMDSNLSETHITNNNVHSVSHITNSTMSLLFATGKQKLKFVDSIVEEMRMFDTIIEATSSTIEISWCRFSTESAYGLGIKEREETITIIQAFRSSVNIMHCAMSENDAVFLKADNSTVSVKNSTFYKNRALSGIVQVHDGSQLSLRHTLFQQNGFYVSTSAVTISNLSSANISSSNFMYNLATNGSCIYLNGKSSVTIFDSMFEGNAAIDSGGVVLAESESVLDLYGCSFQGNRAEFRGVLFRTSPLMISLGLVPGTNRGGGVIFAQTNTHISVKNCTFEKNACPFCCGSVINSGQGGTLTIIESHFFNQMAHVNSVCGLGIALDFAATLHVFHTAFTNYGSAIFSEGFSDVRMTSSMWNGMDGFENSFGSILWCLDRCSVSINHCHFVNIAQRGHKMRKHRGVLISVHHGAMSVNDTLFKNITTLALISVNHNSVLLVNNTLFHLTERQCIFLTRNSSAVVIQTNFTLNNVGPILQLKESLVLLQSTMFLRNVGRIMFLTLNSSVLFYGSLVAVNEMHGDMFNFQPECSVELDNVTIAGNSGRLMYFWKSSIRMKNTNIVGQDTLESDLFIDGGASKVSIQNCDVSNHATVNNEKITISPRKATLRLFLSNVTMDNTTFRHVANLKLENSQVNVTYSTCTGAVFLNCTEKSSLTIENSRVSPGQFVSVSSLVLIAASCVINVGQRSSLNLIKTELFCPFCYHFVWQNLILKNAWKWNNLLFFSRQQRRHLLACWYSVEETREGKQKFGRRNWLWI